MFRRLLAIVARCNKLMSTLLRLRKSTNQSWVKWVSRFEFITQGKAPVIYLTNNIRPSRRSTTLGQDTAHSGICVLAKCLDFTEVLIVKPHISVSFFVVGMKP